MSGHTCNWDQRMSIGTHNRCGPLNTDSFSVFNVGNAGRRTYVLSTVVVNIHGQTGSFQGGQILSRPFLIDSTCEM